MPKSLWVAGAAALAIVAVALVAVGCGETVIDDEKTEGTLEQNLDSSTGKKVASVDCPSDVEVEPKMTFECTVSYADGGEETVKLMILNEDADIEIVDLSPAK